MRNLKMVDTFLRALIWTAMFKDSEEKRVKSANRAS